MTLHPIPTKFPCIWGNFIDFLKLVRISLFLFYYPTILFSRAGRYKSPKGLKHGMKFFLIFHPQNDEIWFPIFVLCRNVFWTRPILHSFFYLIRGVRAGTFLSYSLHMATDLAYFSNAPNAPSYRRQYKSLEIIFILARMIRQKTSHANVPSKNTIPVPPHFSLYSVSPLFITPPPP